MPARALGAPQTTWVGSPPASTMHTLSRSAFGCGRASITRATTKPSYLRPGSSMLSTSRPTRVRVSTISASEADVSRWSRSQERVNFIGSFFSGSRNEASSQSHLSSFIESIEPIDSVASHLDEPKRLRARKVRPVLDPLSVEVRLGTIVCPFSSILQFRECDSNSFDFDPVGRMRVARVSQNDARAGVLNRAENRREPVPGRLPADEIAGGQLAKRLKQRIVRSGNSAAQCGLSRSGGTGPGKQLRDFELIKDEFPLRQVLLRRSCVFRRLVVGGAEAQMRKPSSPSSKSASRIALTMSIDFATEGRSPPFRKYTVT